VSFSGYKLRQLNALANVWVDIPTGTKFVPYVGGGIGISAFEVDGETDSGFAWQLGAGVAYHLTDGLAVTGDVRYRSANSVQFAYDEESGIALDRVKTWNYGLGLRYTF
jgi:opacity protein-like surface antigen